MDNILIFILTHLRLAEYDLYLVTVFQRLAIEVDHLKYLIIRDLFRDRIAALPMAASGWKRVFLGNAMDVELDASSRILVSLELRAAAGLSRELMLLGMGSHFELWDAAAYAEHEAQVMRSEMPGALKDFSV